MADEYQWEDYVDDYRRALDSADVDEVTSRIKEGDYVFDDCLIRLNKNIHPLHVNHFTLFESVLSFKPKTSAEVNALCGDARKSKDILGSKPKIKLKELVKMMVEYDLEESKKEYLVKNGVPYA